MLWESRSPVYPIRIWKSILLTIRIKSRGCRQVRICQPHKSAIEAALWPEETDYLFYVLKPDGSGSHNFAATDTEFAQSQGRISQFTEVGDRQRAEVRAEDMNITNEVVTRYIDGLYRPLTSELAELRRQAEADHIR